MRVFRIIFLSTIIFFGAQLSAAQQSYFLLAHQVHNFLVDKCSFNLHKEWENVFCDFDWIEENLTISQNEWRGIELLRLRMLESIEAHCKTQDLQSQFNFSEKTIESLIFPKFSKTSDSELKSEFLAIESVINDRSVRGNSDALGKNVQTGCVARIEIQNLTDAEFISELGKFISSFFLKKHLQARIKSAKSKWSDYLSTFWASPPPVCVKIMHDDTAGIVYFVGFPCEELARNVERGFVVLDSPGDVYIGIDRIDSKSNRSNYGSSSSQSFGDERSVQAEGENSESERLQDDNILIEAQSYSYLPSKKTVGACLLGALAVTGGVLAYQNRDIISTSINRLIDGNECGCNVIAGPNCTSPWEIRCRAENVTAGACGPNRLGADDPTHFVVGKCSENNSMCPSKDFQPAAFVGGRNSNGVPYACTIENGLRSDLAFVGQIAPDAWYCPVGKSPFHFLKDGRLCLNTSPVIRAGVDKPYCEESSNYCKLPDGLILYRYGDDMLLRPPCGEGFEQNGFKICKIDDLKLYRQKDGEYTTESPCDYNKTGGVCVFDENLIEFYNPLTQKWQDQPAEWPDGKRLFRFNPQDDQPEGVKVFCNSNGECIVFKKASGHWTTNFPCNFNEGLCLIDNAVFYSKKDSGVWIEGKPCSADEEFFILQNGLVNYPHSDSSGNFECRPFPQWKGDCAHVKKGYYIGPDKSIFVPGKDAASWIPLKDAEETGKCFFDKETTNLSRCDEQGRVHYWHNNCNGYGWFDVPMCTGNECDGICQGSDGRIFILNDDLTEWILEPKGCQHETELFCVDEETKLVKYWHRGEFDENGVCVEPGFWDQVPDCSSFLDDGVDFCLGPDGNIFKLVEEDEFELLDNPEDISKSRLFVFKYGKNFATWDPAQQKWILNDAPCSCSPESLCCSIDDGNEIYSYKNPESSTGWSWDLIPHTDDGVDVIVCNKDRQPSPRWRQISQRRSVDAWREDGSKIVETGWTKMRQCKSCDRRYTVSREVYNQAHLEQNEAGRADIVINPERDPYTCRNVHVDNLSEYCPDCRLQN